MCEGLTGARSRGVRRYPSGISYDSDELEDSEEITRSLMQLSEESLHDFLASEPDIYTLKDLKVRYR